MTPSAELQWEICKQHKNESFAPHGREAGCSAGTQTHTHTGTHTDRHTHTHTLTNTGILLLTEKMTFRQRNYFSGETFQRV